MKKYKPLFDKLYWIIFIPTIILVVGLTVVAAFDTVALITIIPVDLFIIYFFISPLFGYVELRENSLFIRYGLILKKEIPYSSIRELVRDRRFYANSMMSLKNAFDHVNIKYNKFDLTCVSVVNNDEFIKEVNERIKKAPTEIL